MLVLHCDVGGFVVKGQCHVQHMHKIWQGLACQIFGLVFYCNLAKEGKDESGHANLVGLSAIVSPIWLVDQPYILYSSWLPTW